MKFNLILFIQETIIPTTKFGIVLPLLIFGAVELVAGWLQLTLPETTNTLLPESVDDAIVIDRYSYMLGVLPLNMGTSRKERMGKQYINRKWIPTLLEKK